MRRDDLSRVVFLQTASRAGHVLEELQVSDFRFDRAEPFDSPAEQSSSLWTSIEGARRDRGRTHGSDCSSKFQKLSLGVRRFSLRAPSFPSIVSSSRTPFYQGNLFSLHVRRLSREFDRPVLSCSCRKARTRTALCRRASRRTSRLDLHRLPEATGRVRSVLF